MAGKSKSISVHWLFTDALSKVFKDGNEFCASRMKELSDSSQICTFPELEEPADSRHQTLGNKD